jgi:hypothetical protein
MDPMNRHDKFSTMTMQDPLFQVLLELAETFAGAPGTAYDAAMLSLVYEAVGAKQSQQLLVEWLRIFTEPFVLSPVRDETNLPTKTVAAAALLLAAARQGVDDKIPSAQLIDFLEYAAKQGWFEDDVLAFYCHQLAEQVTACEQAAAFFSTRYERFLQRRHPVGIAQSLIVLGDGLATTEKGRGYEMLEALLGERSPLEHVAWGMWALATGDHDTGRLAELMKRRLDELMGITGGKSGVSGVLLLSAMGASRQQLDDFITSHQSSRGARAGGIRATEDTLVISPRAMFSVSLGDDLPSLRSLSVALLALIKARRDRKAIITGLDEGELEAMTARIARIHHGGTELTTTEQAVMNWVIIAMVAAALFGALFFMLGGTLGLDATRLQLSSWTVDEIAIWLAMLDYLLGIIKHVRSSGNALRGALQIPVFRHLGRMPNGGGMDKE